MLGLEAAPRARSFARGGYYTATHNVPKGGGGCPSTSQHDVCSTIGLCSWIVNGPYHVHMSSGVW